MIGSISQWGEVSKVKKDRAKSKVKESTTTSLGESTNQGKGPRGGRGGLDGGRGRGRATERGRGGRGRGASVAPVNGSRAKENLDTSVPTTESTAWDTTATTDAPAWDAPKATGEDSWGTTATDGKLS